MRIDYPKNAEWLQRKGEGDQAYAMFQTFLQLNPIDRSILSASNQWRKMHGKAEEPKAINGFAKWSARNAWSARAEAYDKWISDLTFKKDIEAKVDRAQGIKEDAEELIALLLKEMLEAKRTGNPLIISDGEEKAISQYLFGRTGAFPAVMAGIKAVTPEKKEVTVKAAIAIWNV